MKAFVLASALMVACAASALAQDVCAPSGVTTTSIVGNGRYSLAVRWTPTGDDCATGNASTYEVRYTPTSGVLSDPGWCGASYVTGSSEVNGEPQCIVLSGLSCNTTYYVTVFLKDEAGNRSPIGNVTSGATHACNMNTIATCD